MDSPRLDMPESPHRGESASDALAIVALVRSRARNIQKRIWLLPMALGVAAIIAVSFYSKAVTMKCWQTADGVTRAVTCTPTSSGVSVTASGISLPVGSSYSILAKPRFVWNPGGSHWFWVVAIALSVLLSLVLQPGKRSVQIYATHGLSVIAGSFVILMQNRLGIPIQIAPILGVCLALCIVAFSLHSSLLASVAAMSFLAWVAPTRNLAVLVPYFQVWLPPPSQGYIAAGAILIFGSIALYMQTSRVAQKIAKLHNS